MYIILNNILGLLGEQGPVGPQGPIGIPGPPGTSTSGRGNTAMLLLLNNTAPRRSVPYFVNATGKKHYVKY